MLLVVSICSIVYSQLLSHGILMLFLTGFVAGKGPHAISAVPMDVYVLRNSFVTLQLASTEANQDVHWIVKPVSKRNLFKSRRSFEGSYKLVLGPMDEDLDNITVIASYKENKQHASASATLMLGGEYLRSTTGEAHTTL